MSAIPCQIRPFSGRRLPNPVAGVCHAPQPARVRATAARGRPHAGRVQPSGPPSQSAINWRAVSEKSAGFTMARVRLACGRLAMGVHAMLEAYRFGVQEGPHREPWSPEYHAAAVKVYAESLPWSYQRDIANLFHDGEKAMAGKTIPSDLAEDWAIVSAYMHNACAAIDEWLESGDPAIRTDPSPWVGMSEGPPAVIHFDGLAALSTEDGVRRLERAAHRVLAYFEQDEPQSLTSDERLMLRRLVASVPIADVAAEMGYSERTMYRELSKLWDKLGVPDRVSGLRRATAEGLLDDSASA